MPFFVIQGLLGEDCSCGEIRTVCLNSERARVVWGGQDWSRSDERLQGVKGGLLIHGPPPFDVILGEVKEGVCMVGEVLDEAMVEVHEA